MWTSTCTSNGALICVCVPSLSNQMQTFILTLHKNKFDVHHVHMWVLRVCKCIVHMDNLHAGCDIFFNSFSPIFPTAVEVHCYDVFHTNEWMNESVHKSVPLAGHFSLVSHQLHTTVCTQLTKAEASFDCLCYGRTHYHFNIFQSWDTYCVMLQWCVLSALSRVVGGAEASAECLVDPGDMFAETEAERKAHSPPPSLVPRLHCIIAHKLTHSNPLLPSELAVPVQREGANLTAAHKDTTILSFFFEVCACASLSKRHAVVCVSINSFFIPPLHP